MRRNLSQQKLLEILITEIEILQQTSKNIKEVAPEISRKLNEIRTIKLKADLNTERLEWLLNNHEKEMKRIVVTIKLFVLGMGVLLGWSIIQTYFQ